MTAATRVAQSMDNKKHVLIAWEMGDGFGHLRNVVAMARKLSDLRITLAVQSAYVACAAELVPHAAVINCPPLMPRTDWRRADRYSGVLANIVPGDTDFWKRIGADVLLAESAPHALQALIGTIPTLAFGTPYGIPCDGDPLMRDAETGTAQQDIPCADVSEPWCYPELDPYPRTGHVGPLVRFPAMPAGDGTFAYLDWNYPDLQRVLDQLPNESRIFIKNGRSPLSGFDLAHELRRADYVVHHGSQGIAHACLDTGRGQLCLPWHRENEVTAVLLARANLSHAPGSGELDRMAQAMEVRGAYLTSRHAATHVADSAYATTQLAQWEITKAKRFWC